MSGGDLNGQGGAIFSAENLTILQSVISGNATSDVGGNSGGTINFRANLAIGGTTLSSNHAGDGGGGIFSVGTYSSTLVSNSTLTGNTARFSGGAIFQSTGAPTLANSTLSANAAGFAGGGLFNRGTARVEFSTITGNSAPNGTGSGIASVDNAYTNTQLRGTIVSANFNNDDVGIVVGGVTNRFTSLGYNLIGGGSAALAFAASERGITDPGLASLANNGGPTMTHALLPGSLAINGGDPTAVAGSGGVPTTDQRGAGFSRIFGNRIDVGAYEHQQLVTAVVDTQADELDSNRGAGTCRSARRLNSPT